MKKCSICELVKELIEFHKMKGTPDGRRKQCRECRTTACAADYIVRKTKIQKSKREYYRRSRIQILNAVTKYRQANPDKVRSSKRSSVSKKLYKYNNIRSRYRAAKLRAIPKWITQDQLRQIEYVYRLASISTELTGILHHVDHIIPLQGINVSGLHVPWNLQVLTSVDNIRKGNKLLIKDDNDAKIYT